MGVALAPPPVGGPENTGQAQSKGLGLLHLELLLLSKIRGIPEARATWR